MGDLIGARVTLIARDGRVVGDSAEPFEALGTLENHAGRPEILGATATGLGTARRASATLDIDMLYVAAPVTHETVAFVRMALPLSDVRQQLGTVLTATLMALGLALVGAAGLAFLLTGRLGQRVALIAGVAERYGRGDLTPPRLDYGDDELGTVARALDQSVQELGRRLEEQARDRARTEAILAGMIEGVIVGRCARTPAACQRRRAPDAQARRAGDRPALRRDDSASGHRGSGRRGARRPDTGLGAALAAARRVANHHGARRTRAIQRVAWRRPRPARHHRPAAGRSDPARLRGQRLARTADAADRHPRLRRGARRRRRHARRGAAVPGHHHAACAPHGAARQGSCCAWPVSTPGRRRSRWSSCDTRSLVQSVASDLVAPFEERDQQRGHQRSDQAPSRSAADPAKLHDVLRNLLANASTYAPEHSTVIVVTRGPIGDRIDHLGLRHRAGHTRRRSAAGLRTLLPGGQVARARSRRHRPRAGDRETPRGAPRRIGPGREPAGRRCDVHYRIEK